MSRWEYRRGPARGCGLTLALLGLLIAAAGGAGLAGALKMTHPGVGVGLGLLAMLAGLLFGMGSYALVADGGLRTLTETRTGLLPGKRVIPFADLKRLALHVRYVPASSQARATPLYDVLIEPREGPPILAYEHRDREAALREGRVLADILGLPLSDTMSS